MTRSLAPTLNALGLYAVALVLAVAFAAQLLLDELPCPLCLAHPVRDAVRWGRFSTSVSGRAPATMPCRCSPRSPARLSPRGRFYCTSCLAIPAMARHCSDTIITPGLHRLCRCHHCARGGVAVGRAVQGRRQAAAQERVCTRRRVVGDRTHRAERSFDAHGMRLRRLSGQPGRVRASQTGTVRVVLTPTQ